MKPTTIIVLLSILLMTIGCNRESRLQYNVKVDSINDGSPMLNAGLKYVIISGIKNIDTNDLQFKEFSIYVERALLDRGLTKVDSFENADLAVFCYYNISEPSEHQYSYSTPVFGQTGVSSSNTYGTVNSYGRSAYYSGTTTYNPTYGVTGYMQNSGTYITYTRFIALSAKSIKGFKATGKETLKWETKIYSTGSSGDLRRVFPYMISAAVPYIGSNTGQKIEVTLYEDDEIVNKIKFGKIDRNKKSTQQGNSPEPVSPQPVDILF